MKKNNLQSKAQTLSYTSQTTEYVNKQRKNIHLVRFDWIEERVSGSITVSKFEPRFASELPHTEPTSFIDYAAICRFMLKIFLMFFGLWLFDFIPLGQLFPEFVSDSSNDSVINLVAKGDLKLSAEIQNHMKLPVLAGRRFSELERSSSDCMCKAAVYFNFL